MNREYSDEMASISLLSRFIADERTTRMEQAIHTKVHRAILVKRGKIIAEATNRIGTRSRGSGYSERTIHAEKNVVKKIGNTDLLKGADMYVMRQGKGDNRDGFMCSKPCHDCQCFLEKCMREYGLKNVYYTS